MILVLGIKKTLSNFLKISFLCLAAILVGTRCYLVLKQIDPMSGFYSYENWISHGFTVLFLLVAGIGLFASFSGYSSRDSQIPVVLDSKPRILWGSAAITVFVFLARECVLNIASFDHIAFLPRGIAVQPADQISRSFFFITFLFAIISLILLNKNLQNHLGVELFKTLYMISNLWLIVAIMRISLAHDLGFLIITSLSAVVLLFLGITLLSGLGQKFLKSRLYQILNFLPVIWLTIMAMKISIAYSTVFHISEHVLEIVTLIFLLKAFLGQAFLLRSDNPSGTQFTSCKISCALATLFSLLILLPGVLLRYANPTASMFDPLFYYNKFTLLVLVFGIYILCVWLSLLRQERIQNKMCSK